MKYTLILSSIALVSALPAGSSPPTGKTFSEGGLCDRFQQAGLPDNSEACLGTKEFCEKNFKQEKFANAADCLASRKSAAKPDSKSKGAAKPPAPVDDDDRPVWGSSPSPEKPFLEGDLCLRFQKAGLPDNSEACLGSKKFCEKNFKQEKFANAADCLASRKSGPKAKSPKSKGPAKPPAVEDDDRPIWS
ncbi:hypothetical protein AAL_07839 [Moelleriella libera RCEF 2490]|uniref:Uncharacterized protein n=1 Tax=Moelleriella libera RCEF 2490 TaxID=1081109 RepID=A0A167WRT9_9HYPO|nr:hypothetical protein AAL_07839 [Moelleriella libera RCEF 2490]